MQLKRPSTARTVASQLRRLVRGRTKVEQILIVVIVVLVLLIVWVELEPKRSEREAETTGADEDRISGAEEETSGVIEERRSLGKKQQEKNVAVKEAEEAANSKQEVGEPKLEIFVQRVRNALGPFMKKYTDKVPAAPLAEDSEACGVFWSSRMDGWSFPPCSECPKFDTLKEAKARCVQLVEGCGGVTQLEDGEFQIRPLGGGPVQSASERSWKKIPDFCKTKNTVQSSSAKKVWDAFHDATDAALEDDSLNLMKKLYDVREDGSIFISIASYRDHTCGATLKKAFERAKYPEKLSAGIVQQNCVHPTKCMTGTGWANTRQWVKSKGPDPDCAEEFCKSELGRKHCEEGRVRILRLDEIDSLGPFFTRFLNSKLWRGENFYLQIDAHTDFRSHWDESLAAQMRATRSYPFSVISNYPPSGTPSDTRPWSALKEPSAPDSDYGVPSSLCGCTFETAGGEHMTVRLAQTGRRYRSELGRPRRSLFVAAGFFIAHGSIVNNVGFDPFLPFLFMGEEIALSIRFYTNGYDIFGPSAEVLRHEYVRKESPKFWESVGQVYSAPNLHNQLTDLIVQRVQNLVRFPEADAPQKIRPQTLLTRLDAFGLGTVRTADQFTKIAGMDLVAKTQSVPDWCYDGRDPADAVEADKLKRLSSGLDVDLLH